jgi:hypothetical protein
MVMYPDGTKITVVPSEDIGYICAILLANEDLDATLLLTVEQVTDLIQALQVYASEIIDGARLIAAERERQLTQEGWNQERDTKKHPHGELAMAAACYIYDYMSRPNQRNTAYYHNEALVYWPWAWKWWKPTPNVPIRQLVKAGALIAAEIDRLQAMEEVSKHDKH